VGPTDNCRFTTAGATADWLQAFNTLVVLRFGSSTKKLTKELGMSFSSSLKCLSNTSFILSTYIKYVL